MAPARATIALVSYLTLYNLKNSVSSKLPQTGSLAWVELYLLVNMIFLWLSITVTIISFMPFVQCEPVGGKSPVKSNEPHRKELQAVANPLSTAVPDIPADVVKTVFDRYDLDGCGLIDNFERLQQVTLNLVTKLHMPVRPGELERALQGMESLIHTGPFDLEDFTTWFEESVHPSLLVDTCNKDNKDDADKASKKSILSEPAQIGVKLEEASDAFRNWVQNGSLAGVIFPCRGSNYVDRCAKFWIPISYVIALLGMFAHII